MTPSSSRLVSWWHTCSEGRMFCPPYLKQKIRSDARGPPWAPARLRASPFGEGNGIMYMAVPGMHSALPSSAHVFHL